MFYETQMCTNHSFNHKVNPHRLNLCRMHSGTVLSVDHLCFGSTQIVLIHNSCNYAVKQRKMKFGGPMQLKNI